MCQDFTISSKLKSLLYTAHNNIIDIWIRLRNLVKLKKIHLSFNCIHFQRSSYWQFHWYRIESHLECIVVSQKDIGIFHFYIWFLTLFHWVILVSQDSHQVTTKPNLQISMFYFKNRWPGSHLDFRRRAQGPAPRITLVWCWTLD